jgi:hypothetical protein
MRLFGITPGLAAATWLAAAVPPAMADAPGITQLKAQVLDLEQAALAAEARQPDAAAFTLYIGGKDATALIRSVSIQIDDAGSARYEYSEVEAVALRKNALHTILAVDLAPGAHRLRAQFQGRTTQGSGEFFQATIDQTFTKAAGPAALELDLLKSNYFSGAKLALRDLEAPAAGDKAAPMENPHQRAAAFLAADGRDFAVLCELLKAQDSGPAPSADYGWQLADAYAVFGMDEQAQALYRQYTPSTPSAQPAESPVNPIDPLLAQYNQALSMLDDPAQAPAGVSLLQQLAGNGGVKSEEFLVLRDKVNLTLGYYLLRHQQGQAAAPFFRSVRSPGPYANRATLGLGWALMAPSGEAKAGPAPQHDPQTPARLDVVLHPRLTADIDQARRYQPFPLTQATPHEAQVVRTALVPWVELTGRDPLDPSVQEGMLAIPYSLLHIGAYEEAQQRYDTAVKTLTQVDGWLERALSDVESGGMVAALDRRETAQGNGWHWWLADTDVPDFQWWQSFNPQPPETFYFRKLFADAAFLDALEDYRDLRSMAAAVDAQAVRLPGGENGEVQARIAGLRPALAAALEAQRGRLSQAAAAVVKRYQKQTRAYLAEAHFSLARINDQPPASAGAGS